MVRQREPSSSVLLTLAWRVADPVSSPHRLPFLNLIHTRRFLGGHLFGFYNQRSLVRAMTILKADTTVENISENT